MLKEQTGVVMVFYHYCMPAFPIRFIISLKIQCPTNLVAIK